MCPPDKNNKKIDLVDLPPLRIDEKKYHLLDTEKFHSNIVQSTIESHNDVSIITPTLHSGCFEYYALAALFQNMGSLTPVFIITPDTSIRDRYEKLENGMQYSTARWPLATVKANKELSYRTEHVRDDDAPPGVIFTRYSTRLPKDEISKNIRTVIYDDAVKFEEERWKQFREWRMRNEIPSVIYFIRDPVGPVYQHIKNDVDITWNWTPDGIKSFISTTSSPKDSTQTVPNITNIKKRLLENKLSGQTHKLHICSDGPVVDSFATLWDTFEELEKSAEKIDEKQLYTAVGVAKRALNGFTQLLSSLEYSDNYRAEHGKATTLSGRISQVEHIKERLTGDAAAGRTPVDHVHHALTELREAITDADTHEWKRGAVLTAMQKAVDENKSIIVVVPDDPSREALQADLRITQTEFYSKARDNIHFHTPRSLPNAVPADYLLIYGAPKYKHRWLLRTTHSPYVGILAYQHELGLLHSQVNQLNQELREATPIADRDSTEAEVLNAISAPNLFEPDTDFDSLDYSPTDPGLFDGISIDIPDEDDDEKGETPFDDYEIIDTSSRDSIDDLVDESIPDFDSRDATYSPSDGNTGFETSSSQDRGKKVDAAVEIHVRDNEKSLILKSTNKLEVVNQDTGNTIKKPVNSIQPGEQIIAVADRDVIRDAVEKLLLDSGYIDLIGYSRLWKNKLQTEIDERGDSLEDFIDRVENEGVDKQESTYEDWYNGEVTLPKAKKSLHAIASGYNMDEVLEEFENVWEANHKIRNIKRDFIDMLKKRSQDALAGDTDNDPVIDEELDIRLSDLDPTDEEGNEFVQAHIVTNIEDVGEVSRGLIGRWR
jgi:hypothetical protein